MQADIFVHPDFSKLDEVRVTPHIEAYEERLRLLVSQSECAILVYSINERVWGKRTSFWDLFDENSRFESGRMYHDQRPSDGGSITTREDYRDLAKLLDTGNIDSGLVHGSYLGLCTQGFALQLYGILNGLDIRSPLQKPNDSLGLEIELARDGKIAEGNVKFGTVLDHPFHDTEGITKELIALSEGKKIQPCLTTQLFGQSTAVHETGLTAGGMCPSSPAEPS